MAAILRKSILAIFILSISGCVYVVNEIVHFIIVKVY